MPRILTPTLLITLSMAGCMKYVPANLPLQLDDPAVQADPADPAYQDELGRTLAGADADGPEFRITLHNGTRFDMKSPRVVGDSVVGYYRPSKGQPWARASISLYDVRSVDEEKIDWLATSSLLVFPITIALLITN